MNNALNVNNRFFSSRILLIYLLENIVGYLLKNASFSNSIRFTGPTDPDWNIHVEPERIMRTLLERLKNKIKVLDTLNAIGFKYLQNQYVFKQFVFILFGNSFVIS